MNTESGLRERKKQRTRRDIATAAVRLFAEHGYEAVTVAQIAAAANVSRATFFNYFPDKEAVLFDDTTAHRDLLREVLTDLSHATTPRQALLQAVDRMLDGPALSLDPHSELVPVRARLIAGEPALRARALLRVADVHAIWARTLHEAFSEQLDQMEAAALAGAVIGAVLGAVTVHLNSGAEHGSLPEVARKAARSVLGPGPLRDTRWP